MFKGYKAAARGIAEFRTMPGGNPQPLEDDIRTLLNGAIVDAYERGWQWATDNPGCGEFVRKAAHDYADKQLNTMEE